MTKNGGALIELKAEPPSDAYRSIWTDLRRVSFCQGWIDVDGIRTRYLRAGDSSAPKLVLMPGTGGHAETYAAALGPLSEHFDCWAVDMIGQGYTDKPPVFYDSFVGADFLTKLFATAGFTRASLIGVSVGTWYALRLAVTRPELVDRLVLVAPVGGPEPEPEDGWYEFWNASWDGADANSGQGAAGTAQLRQRTTDQPTWDGARQILSQLIEDPRNVTDDMIAARLDVVSQPGAREAVPRVLWWTDGGRRHANTLSRTEISGISAPVLLCVGTSDPLRPLARALNDLIPNCSLAEFEGAGHWIQYEVPGQFNELALQFLTGD